jgi:hypothetical protein
MNEDTEVITINEEKLKASVDKVIEESINKDVVVDILPCEEDVIDTFEDKPKNYNYITEGSIIRELDKLMNTLIKL